MSEKRTIDPTDVVHDDERKRREESGIASLMAGLLDKQRTEWYEEIKGEIEKLDKKPDRSKVPNIVDSKGEPRARLASPTEPAYRRMSEPERDWRNPDADHWMAEWIRGDFYRDRARVFQAESKLGEIFGRASTLEGTPGTDGGISTGTGGALIPRPLENVVLIARDRAAKMRRFATVMTMTRQSHTIPTAGAMTASMVGESTTAAQGEPTFAEVQLNAHKAQVKAIASEEVLEDAAINLVSIYANRAGGAIGVLEDNQFFKTGDGTGNNVSAFLAGTAFTETTSGTLSYTDLLGQYFALPEAYLDNSRWLVASDVLQLMSALKDGNGRPFYQSLVEPPRALDDDSGTSIGTLLGRPVHRVPFTAGTIWFGDPAACYLVGSRQGIRVASSEHRLFDLDQVMWKFTTRFDGINVDLVAGRNCTGITVVNTL